MKVHEASQRPGIGLWSIICSSIPTHQHGATTHELALALDLLLLASPKKILVLHLLFLSSNLLAVYQCCSVLKSARKADSICIKLVLDMHNTVSSPYWTQHSEQIAGMSLIKIEKITRQRVEPWGAHPCCTNAADLSLCVTMHYFPFWRNELNQCKALQGRQQQQRLSSEGSIW